MTRMKLKRQFAHARMIIFFAAGAVSVDAISDEIAVPPVPPGFHGVIKQMRSEWSIPGIALAIVDGDKTTFVGAHGVRERGLDAPITPDTMFGIASITKVLVAGGIGVLVDAGALDWDDRVIEHLPEFRLADPHVTAEVTIRDLLVHRSGIASYGDWLEEIPGLSESDALARMAHLDQSSSFRYGTEYSSYSFIVLTEIIRKVTGKPWGEFLDEQVWTPLAMNHTYAHADDFIAPENVLPTGDGWSTTIKMGQAAVDPDFDVAAPHVKWEAFIDPDLVFEKRELAFDVSHFHRTAIDPGQGAYTSVTDLAKWARVLLNNGTTGGYAVLEPGTVDEMRLLHNGSGRRSWPAADTACDTTDTDLRTIGVALGLFLFDYCGHVLYGHSGGELGYESLLVIDPRQHFAIVVLLNNTRSSSPARAIVQTVLDWRYGYGNRSWPEKFKLDAIAENRETYNWMSEMAISMPEVTLEPERMQRFPGRYHHPFAGELDVEMRDGSLVATTGPTWFLELTYRGDDTFKATPHSPIRYWLTLQFNRDASGDPDELTISHPSFHRPLRFQRTGDKATSAAAGARLAN